MPLIIMLLIDVGGCVMLHCAMLTVVIGKLSLNRYF